MFLNTDNQFTVRGRLVREAIVNISENGNVVTNIRLAQKSPFKQNGEHQTVFIDYTAIDTKNDSVATRLAEYTAKGSLVSLVGYFDSYVKEDEEGNKEYIQTNRIRSFRSEETKKEVEARRN